MPAGTPENWIVGRAPEGETDMTYCLGILLPEGLVLASDSRTNAGVDQIATVRKLAILENPDKAVIALMSAGNLATTQTVVTTLKQAAGTGTPDRDLFLHNSMFDVAQTVGGLLRRILERDGPYVERFGDPNGTFLLAGQIRGEPPRLFQVYSAGNFVEATPRNHYLQIGETKYGKPILDRALRFDNGLARAAKLALISFDATIRSNLSVGPPIDVLCYQTDSFSTRNLIKYKNSDPYFTELKQRYSDGIQATVDAIPEPRLCPEG
ncbi:putative proteasome-type protease [Thalassobaculum litoreum DSM 18839]|uniref:Putative proteasome-type protease n=2 Tax=Thalassobaculaceae TaxID=2844864 RepID=A0A8G2ETY5_9PROT|nr:putative proteasome-type protease [Thalassobaculum litoreum DSM 18839]